MNGIRYTARKTAGQNNVQMHHHHLVRRRIWASQNLPGYCQVAQANREIAEGPRPEVEIWPTPVMPELAEHLPAGYGTTSEEGRRI